MINNVFVSIAVPFLSLLRAARLNVCACGTRMFYIGQINAVIGSDSTYIALVNMERLRWPVRLIARKNDQKIDFWRPKRPLNWAGSE